VVLVSEDVWREKKMNPGDGSGQTISATMTRLLTTDLLSVEGKALNVMTIEVAPGSVGRRNHHAGPELLYVVEGVGVLEVEGKSHVPLSAGTVTMVDPHEIHVSKNASQTHALKLLVIQLLENTPASTRERCP